MVRTSHLLNAVIATQAISAAVPVIKTTRSRKSFYLTGTTASGAGSATVLVEACNDAGASGGWVTLATLSIILATVPIATTAQGYATDAAYETFRMRVTAISGTGASLDGWAAN